MNLRVETITGAAIAGVIGGQVAWYNGHLQAKRDRLAEERFQREAAEQRLREGAGLVGAALALVRDGSPAKLSFVREGENEPRRTLDDLENNGAIFAHNFLPTA
jgi:hypothetical protein